MPERMSTRGPSVGGGVHWFLPGRKSRIAETTSATSLLVEVLVEDGASTFAEVRDRIVYDPDAVELCDRVIRLGLGERRIRLVEDGGGIVFA